ncbi:predicted protein [Histoplasma capsulatum G186AR]|uniref:Uncharacterized protein n=2 Tax=Ajellomyces capsulatus TaxID=5037 RepID=C0NY67_AJECG|nr:uncharacterized protein HCBG_07861 [Histoplasma capsulatum G186AR]EEH03735.1 predicted protein [Histoplasma capsulatum G186AR]KAG5293692.1 hypothetical protein I7I52_05096 [Histoplasma capsulatum]QSS75144.1 hypothetical protein I7I50_04188 [Histoplasma capsulatum G186AR]
MAIFILRDSSPRNNRKEYQRSHSKWREREQLSPFQPAHMDLYFSVVEKRLATSIAFVWVFYRFGRAVVKLLRKYLNRSAARRRQVHRSSRVAQDSQTTETSNATAGQT